MTTAGVMLLGCLLGMRHALEADHVAAVAALATRSGSLRHTVSQGVFWGLGHTLTLLLFGSVVLLLHVGVPERLAALLEFAVGVMLILLGLDVWRRLRRSRPHIHTHTHTDGTMHWHLHAHAGEPAHTHGSSRHEHDHAAGLPWRALFVGLMHGMAGSAALILLTLETVRSPAVGLLYIALFGAGSIAGMAALSAVIAVPLRYSAHRLIALHGALQGLVGGIALALGARLIYETGPLAFALGAESP